MGKRAGVGPYAFVSGRGVEVDAIVVLLVGAELVSSECDCSSGLSISGLAACECCIGPARAAAIHSRWICPSVRSISRSKCCRARLLLCVQV